MKMKILYAAFFVLTASSCSSPVDEDFKIKTDPNYYDVGYPIPPSNVAQVARRYNIPGMQAVHLKGDDVNSYVYGYNSNTTLTRVTDQSIFQAASLSKCVAAYLFLKLADQGVIDLDEPISEYFTYNRLSDDPRNLTITGRQVLAHIGGLVNWASPEGSLLTVTSTPGTRYSYSGEGYQYLQKAVEHVTGKGLQELAKEEIFDLFEMNSTSFHWENRFNQFLTVGHRNTSIPYNESKFGVDRANAAFSLYTTALDFAKFMKRGLINGEGLSPESYQLLLTTESYPNSESNLQVTRSLGMVVQQNERGLSLYHTGSNAGYRAVCIVYPETKEALVVFTNSDLGVNTFRYPLFNLMLGEDQTFYVFTLNT